MSETYEKKASRRGWFAWSLAIILLIALPLAYIMYRLKIKVKDAEIDSKFARIVLLSKELENKIDENSVFADTLRVRDMELVDLKTTFTQNNLLTQSRENTFCNSQKRTLSVIDSICSIYFDKASDNPKLKLSLIEDINNEINRFRESGNIDCLVELANISNNNIIDRLRKQMPTLKPEHITLLALNLMGFSPKSISLLMNMNLKNFYMKRSRIFKRIETSDIPEKDTLLKELGA